jgi:hypothetical protein
VPNHPLQIPPSHCPRGRRPHDTYATTTLHSRERVGTKISSTNSQRSASIGTRSPAASTVGARRQEIARPRNASIESRASSPSTRRRWHIASGEVERYRRGDSGNVLCWAPIARTVRRSRMLKSHAGYEPGPVRILGARSSRRKESSTSRATRANGREVPRAADTSSRTRATTTSRALPPNSPMRTRLFTSSAACTR